MDFPPPPSHRQTGSAFEITTADILLGEEDVLFEQSLHAANAAIESPPRNNNGWWLLISMALFALTSLGGFNLLGMGLLVAVLLLHESGHFLGMKLFGYRDVKMFFIPFFGAAVSGKKHAVPAWQEIVVLLLGPLPGLILGTVLFFAFRPTDSKSLMFQLVAMLVALNGFNLLPLIPLDGGRVMNLLIFRRHPALEVVFKIFAVLGLALLAITGSIILGLMAFFMLIGIPYGYKLASRARRLRREFPTIVAEWREQGLAELRQLYQYALDIFPQDRNPANIGTRMISLHEQASTSSPGILGTLFFLMVYGTSFFLGPTVGVVMAIDNNANIAARQMEKAKSLHDEAVALLAEAKQIEQQADGQNVDQQQILKLRSLAEEKVNEGMDLVWANLHLAKTDENERVTSSLADLQMEMMIAKAKPAEPQPAKESVP
ncbi:Peptidase family M50 [Anatilimnocola aggregata]|uniref:Peptidase family M50 n=1 Tax=Anatilimnocola aggregata TaxID=2528021 RepID=A0A517YC33_9BACT|nr:site-2 protease family protein [Anatilimnocola aggregata]QDU27682.1 Peptidase family M50 [Anatilimnocola aggregata]